MRKSLKLAILAATMAFTGACASADEMAADADRNETPIVFTAGGGESAEAFEGYFEVPENRSDPNSRTIKIGYVRFPATGENPGAPIVYLAGGPGGSGTGTAKGRRFPLFMAMREFGDVIAFDQRGTGLSNNTEECVSSVNIPDDVVLPRDEVIALLKQSARECDTTWKSQGVDLRGYTTLESARDLDALRAHLGADKITLWGISYGTHLALAAVKEMGPRIDRMVLASAEGLDQTVKLPSETDAYFDRLQAAVNMNEKARAMYPDIKGMMRRVVGSLNDAPQMITLTKQGSEQANMLLSGQMMQLLASGLISDPGSAAQMLALFQAADAGAFDAISETLSQFAAYGYLSVNEPERWRAMPLAMDVASGISPARLARVEREAQTAITGELLNFPMPQLAGAIDGLDLGDEFRKGPRGAMPTLLLMGTLDGRTYPNEQREAVAGLSNVSVATIENAGHNLFMTSPDVTRVIQDFMRGEEIGERTISLPTPAFIRD